MTQKDKDSLNKAANDFLQLMEKINNQPETHFDMDVAAVSGELRVAAWILRNSLPD